MLKRLILLSILLVSSSSHPGDKIDIGSLVDTPKMAADAQEIILNLGLNCADPTQLPANIAYFVQEFFRILGGSGQSRLGVSSTFGL